MHYRGADSLTKPAVTYNTRLSIFVFLEPPASLRQHFCLSPQTRAAPNANIKIKKMRLEAEEKAKKEREGKKD